MMNFFLVGRVTPVLHYCMGGITIDTQGNVLDENKNIISGLHAAGEVSSGVHGSNRLGGNSLLKCTVFGSIVRKKIPILTSNKETTVSTGDCGKSVVTNDDKGGGIDDENDGVCQ